MIVSNTKDDKGSPKPATDEEFVAHLKRLRAVETTTGEEDEEDAFWLEVIGGGAAATKPEQAKELPKKPSKQAKELPKKPDAG